MMILQVIASTDARSGGVMEAVLRISLALRNFGHTVEIVSLDSVDVQWISEMPFQVHALGPGLGRYGYTSRLHKWIELNRARFDAVVLNGLWNYSSYGAYRGLVRGAVPYFVYVHGMLDPYFRTQSAAKHCAKQLYWWIAEGRVLRDAAGVLFTCEEERRAAAGSFVGYRYDAAVVAFGTSDPTTSVSQNAAAFRMVCSGVTGRKFLLFLGRIHPKKGCDLLLEAFTGIAGAFPELDLVVAGPDQVSWKSDLVRLAESRGIGGRVHWPGMLEGDAKWGAFATCEAFILPSHQENFGIAVAEALACSKPVLISNKVNIWREIEASGAGLVENDDVPGTTRLMTRFLGLSTPARDEMGRKARAVFLASFEIGAGAKDLVDQIVAARV